MKGTYIDKVKSMIKIFCLYNFETHKLFLDWYGMSPAHVEVLNLHEELIG